MSGTLTNTSKNAASAAIYSTSKWIELVTASGVVSGNGYGRFQISYSVAADGTTTPAADTNSPYSTGAWGTITKIRNYSASSGGTQYDEITLTTPIIVDGADQRVTIRTTDITISWP